MNETAGAVRLLRELREARGQSLRQAAAGLGVAPSHLSRLERGEKSPSNELLQRAVKYYNADGPQVGLEYGQVPQDVLTILRTHPEVVEELRRRYGNRTDD